MSLPYPGVVVSGVLRANRLRVFFSELIDRIRRQKYSRTQAVWLMLEWILLSVGMAEKSGEGAVFWINLKNHLYGKGDPADTIARVTYWLDVASNHPDGIASELCLSQVQLRWWYSSEHTHAEVFLLGLLCDYLGVPVQGPMAQHVREATDRIDTGWDAVNVVYPAGVHGTKKEMLTLSHSGMVSDYADRVSRVLARLN